MNKICIIGDILNDITLNNRDMPLKMRLGGIVHSARCLWAMGIKYDVGYFAPSYLDSHIERYLLEHMGCNKIFKLGNVNNCPYTMLINEAKEVGDQGYEFILRDDINITYDDNALKTLDSYKYIFMISGNYEFQTVKNYISNDTFLHYDIANNIINLSILEDSGIFETIFISTSSTIFKNFVSENELDLNLFFNQFKNITNKIILKENRGGSRAYDFQEKTIINIPSQTQKIVHSVGVGDVFDTTCVSYLNKGYSFTDSLYYSSWIASEYAKTTYPEDFKKMTLRILKTPIEEVKSLSGCFLPWEKRKEGHIYLAAPDFDFVDTTLIDVLERSLLYHNFSPHRPIKENGQMPSEATWIEKQDIFTTDMLLLEKCNMLIAILLYNDPGTLIEIGLAAQKKIPTFVYDPFNIADNCMLTQLPDLVSSNLDEIISEVFLSYSKLLS
jgi:nucleoside 2-deoxyribosyltransferase